MNKLQQSLNSVNATEEMKQNTLTYLSKEIENRQHKTRELPVYRLAAACACLLFFIGIGGYNVYSSPVSYISIDVNPSIELELNCWDKVVGVTSYNEDGAKIADNINVKNMQYTEAIQSLLLDEEYQSYLQGDYNLVFTVVSDEEEMILQGIEDSNLSQKYSCDLATSSKECMETAHENHMSFGKYEAYIELSSLDSDITLEDCKDMTMGEIKKLLGQCQGQNSEENNGDCNSDNESNNNNSNGNGNNSNNNGNGNKYHNGKHN